MVKRQRRSRVEASSVLATADYRLEIDRTDDTGVLQRSEPHGIAIPFVEASVRRQASEDPAVIEICGKQKTRKKKAIVAVARKLLVRCWVMLLRKERLEPGGLPRQPQAVVALG